MEDIVNQTRFAITPRGNQRYIPSILDMVEKCGCFFFPVAKMRRIRVSSNEKWIFLVHGKQNITPLMLLQYFRYEIFVIELMHGMVKCEMLMLHPKGIER